MATAVNLGNLFVTLTAHTLQYQKAMLAAQATTEVTTARMGKAVKFASAAMAASLGIVAIASVRAFAQFESSFAGVEKTVDASRAELDELAMAFRNMAKEIPTSVNEINRVGEAAGQLGIELENIEAFTKTMLELGVATNLSAEQAATSLARLANITQLPQTEFDKLGSTIVALGNNLATTEAEIVNMGLRLAGAGSVIGLTEAQILSLAGALSSVGIRAESGGTAFTRVMLEMNNAVSNAGFELEAFAAIAGTTVEDFSKSFEARPAQPRSRCRRVRLVRAPVAERRRVAMKQEPPGRIQQHQATSGNRRRTTMSSGSTPAAPRPGSSTGPSTPLPISRQQRASSMSPRRGASAPSGPTIRGASLSCSSAKAFPRASKTRRDTFSRIGRRLPSSVCSSTCNRLRCAEPIASCSCRGH